MPVPLRSRLSDLGASIDASVRRLALAGLGWLLWPVAYAIALGSGVWAFINPKWVPTLDTNKLPAIDTYWLAGGVGATFLGLWLVYAIAGAVVRRRTGEWRTTETIAQLNARLRPILTLPLIAALTHANIEKESPKLTFFYVALAAVAFGAGVYAWTRGPEVDRGFDEPAPPRPGGERAARFGTGLVLALFWAGYAAFFSRLAITNHRALVTRTTDLGYYDNIFWQSIHGRPLGCSFIKAGYHGSAHFDPLLVALSPLYLLYPRAEFLLVLQSVWLGAGVVPVYLIAKDQLGRRLPSLVLALMYALYPALHGANMYEFHSLTLLTPLLLWVLYFLQKGAFRAYWLMLIPTLLCREDVSLLLCFVGLWAILDGRRQMARTGWLTIAVSLVYFAIVKKFFMTSADIFMSGKNAYSFAYYYEDLIPNHNGMGGLVISLVTNPVFVLKTIFAEPKIIYLLTLFLPLAFLPFFAARARVMLAYGLLFCLLASRAAVYSTHFQYSSTLIPIAFAAAPMALAQIEGGRRAPAFGLDPHRLARGLLGAAFLATVLVSWKFGGLVDNATFKGGFARVARSLTPKDKETYAWLQATIAQIPKNASVGTTNKIGPHVSNRKDVFFYPEKMHTDYVLLDEGELRGGDLDKHSKAVQQGKFVQIARRERMVLFKKAPAGAPAAAPPPPPPAPTGSAAPDPDRDEPDPPPAP